MATAAIVGALCGIALWALSSAVLFAAGISFYAVNTGLPFALAIAIIASPFAYRRARNRSPQAAKYSMAFLIGLFAFLLYGCIAVAITNPHTIIFFA